MKTLSDYTIYCTEEQTKKAWELGAPIKPKIELFTPNLNNTPHCHTYIDGEDVILFIPTAEQMINWLRSKGMKFYFNDIKSLWYLVFGVNVIAQGCSENKEIEAIDAALDYLISVRNK